MQEKGNVWGETDVRGDVRRETDIQSEPGAQGEINAESGVDEPGSAKAWENQGAEKGKTGGGLERELRERLDWYARHASEEEYDPKAVEYILYLLDSVAPLEEGTVPPKDEAWGRFLDMAGSQKELLPVKDGRYGAEAGALVGAGMGAGALADEEFEKAGKIGDSGSDRDNTAYKESVESGKNGKVRKFRKVREFVVRHKVIAAAVLLVVIFAVSGTIQAGARRGTGFFFWLKDDDTGMQMMTSPENLDSETNQKEYKFFDKAEVPEWAQEWIKIEKMINVPDNYEWVCYETSMLENFKSVLSRYLDNKMNKGLILGRASYYKKVSYNEKRYIDYDYVQDYKIGEKDVNVYSKTEESGRIYYAICFYEDSNEYFIEGEENLDELKEVMEKYLECVEMAKNENIL